MTDPSGTVGSAWQPLNKKYVEFPPPPPPSLVDRRPLFSVCRKKRVSTIRGYSETHFILHLDFRVQEKFEMWSWRHHHYTLVWIYRRMHAEHIFKSSKTVRDVKRICIFFVHFQSRVHRAASTASLPNSKWDLRTLVQSWPKAKKSNFSGVDRRGLLRLCSSYSKTPKKFLERNVDL